MTARKISCDKPTEGMWFRVEPLNINRTLFAKTRIDPIEEEIRQIILKAFTELDKKPEKYGIAFETIMPEKKWDEEISVEELKQLAAGLGGHIANWIEQVLEWAQRIANGETWMDLCNKPDTANWYRVVEWLNEEEYQIIGGSRKSFDNRNTATNICSYSFDCKEKVINTIPLVARYAA